MFHVKPLALFVGLALSMVASVSMAQRPGGFGQPGPGGPNSTELKLVEKFDADGDGVLNTKERAEARKEAQKSAGGRRGDQRQ